MKAETMRAINAGNVRLTQAEKAYANKTRLEEQERFKRIREQDCYGYRNIKKQEG